MPRPTAQTPGYPQGGRAIPPVICPFILIQDSREQSPHKFASLLDDADAIEADPFTFDGLQTNADKKYAPLKVRVVRIGISRGDYQILGLKGLTVERKSKDDFYGSVTRRENFIGRLKEMTKHEQRAHVVIECSLEELAASPPRYTKLNPKALMRTVQSWANDYPVVHWWFMPGRAWAEAWTFRLLEDWWRKHGREVEDVTVLDQASGKLVRSIDSPIDGLPGDVVGMAGVAGKTGRASKGKGDGR